MRAFFGEQGTHHTDLLSLVDGSWVGRIVVVVEGVVEAGEQGGEVLERQVGLGAVEEGHYQ
jgi:hypothetical protein